MVNCNCRLVYHLRSCRNLVCQPDIDGLWIQQTRAPTRGGAANKLIGMQRSCGKPETVGEAFTSSSPWIAAMMQGFCLESGIECESPKLRQSKRSIHIRWLIEECYVLYCRSSKPSVIERGMSLMSHKASAGILHCVRGCLIRRIPARGKSRFMSSLSIVGWRSVMERRKCSIVESIGRIRVRWSLLPGTPSLQLAS